MTGGADDPFLAEPAVRAALAEARPGGRPTAATPLGRGNRKRTRLVRFADGGRVVVQVGETDLRTEAALLEVVGERTAVPVPAVLAAGGVDGVSYLVTDHVPGADLHERFASLDDPTRRRVTRAFGRHLADLHATLRVDGYGAVRVDGSGALVAGATDWPAWFGSWALEAVARLPGAFDDLRPALRAALADPPAADPPARLFPWDFRPGNAVVVDGEVAAVLDWEGPLAAPPALSVAKASYLVADWYVADPEPLRAAFRAGYAELRPYPDVEPTHRLAAVAEAAVDSRGTVTAPGWPEADRRTAVEFHRRALEAALDRL